MDDQNAKIAGRFVGHCLFVGCLGVLVIFFVNHFRSGVQIEGIAVPSVEPRSTSTISVPNQVGPDWTPQPEVVKNRSLESSLGVRGNNIMRSKGVIVGTAVYGSRNTKIESRVLGAFSRIELDGSPDLEVSLGRSIAVVVTADDNILPMIETTVEGNKLTISSKNSYITTSGVNVKITLPTLSSVSISGSGDIHVIGLNSGDLYASVAGSGAMTLSGRVNRLRAEIFGSGNLSARGLAAKEVWVTVIGSGNATVRASEQMDASVTGSGDVNYYGNPFQVRRNVVGAGDIKPR